MNNISEIKCGSVIEVDLKLVTDSTIIKPGQYLTYINHYWVYNYITERILFYVSCRLSKHSLDDCLRPQANVDVHVAHSIISRIYNGLCVVLVPVVFIHEGMLDSVIHWPTTTDYNQYLKGMFGNGEQSQVNYLLYPKGRGLSKI